MEIKKATEAISGGVATAAQMEAINAQARGKLSPEQVYVFSLRLCDDQIDRDFERFDTAALPGLAKLFIGKTGIVDHKWGSDAQVARIFSAEVVKEDGISYVKAWAYIRRGGAADEVIADIEAGIKKEVSVGCAMGRAVCSVCGSEYGSCGHHKGGTLRWAALLRHSERAYGCLRIFLRGGACPAQCGCSQGYGLWETEPEGTGGGIRRSGGIPGHV